MENEDRPPEPPPEPQEPEPDLREEGRWKIMMSPEAQTHLDSLSLDVQEKVYEFLFEKLAIDPNGVGEPLAHEEIPEAIKESIRQSGMNPDEGTFGFVDIEVPAAPNDMRCALCGADVYSDDIASFHVLRWNPLTQSNEFVAAYCEDHPPTRLSNEPS